jgi:hypothetical protein
MSFFWVDLSPAFISRTEVHPQLRYVAFHGLPVTQIAGFDVPQPGSNPDLGPLVLQPVKPFDKILSLTDNEHTEV